MYWFISLFLLKLRLAYLGLCLMPQALDWAQLKLQLSQMGPLVH